MAKHFPSPSFRPHLVLRVAVTGHRPPELELDKYPEIRTAIRAVLEHALSIVTPLTAMPDSAYSSDPPTLRVLSSLAEGADRLVAEEASAMRKHHSVSLECPLPAFRGEYRNDFDTHLSREVFDRLLEESSAVFELDGKREGRWLRSSDYHRAGHIAAANCDLLIAIWDKTPGRPGGTGQITREAMENQTPVIRIDPHDPRSLEFCGRAGHWGCDWRQDLQEALDYSFAAPNGALDWLSRFSHESCPPGANDRRRADLLAMRYGGRYRRSYLWKYVLAASAVCCAVVGLMMGPEESRLWPALELLCILGILAAFFSAKRSNWHDRWLDYRLLAEQFRVLDFLHPLAESAPVYHPPTYWGMPPSPHACVRWYFRARLREHRLPNRVANEGYVEEQRKRILGVAQDQMAYNVNKHHSARRQHEMLERGGLLLFIVTAVACVIHLSGGPWPAVYLGGLTAALPAIGASMEGLLAQGESKRISEYAGAMSKYLGDLESRIKMAPLGGGLGSISSVAFQLATEMTRETSGWHNLIHGQPPRL